MNIKPQYSLYPLQLFPKNKKTPNQSLQDTPSFSRAVGDRATEPRVAPLKLRPPEEEDLKEMHLKKIKPKPESKPKSEEKPPILKSLKNGLENLKKNTVREKSETRIGSAGFLERITKLTQGNRSRNPAKKSASFTFALRPEVAMRSKERYSSLEPDPGDKGSNSNASGKTPVHRSVSTSVLEVPVNVELQPDYSRVRDSLTPLPQPLKTPPPKADEIYAEICDNSQQKCPGSHVMARVRIIVKQESPRPKHKYINSVMITGPDSIVSGEDELIYNTVF